MKKITTPRVLTIIFLSVYFLGLFGTLAYHYFHKSLSYFHVGNSLFVLGLGITFGPLAILGGMASRRGRTRPKDYWNSDKVAERWSQDKPLAIIVWTVIGAGALLAITGYALSWIQ